MKSITTALLFLISVSVAYATDPPRRIAQIQNSGDGKSAETAYQVYNINEEYQLLAYLKLNPKMQMLSVIEGQYFDILLVGETMVWFKLVSTQSKNS